jgi:hypothetical protein
MTLGIHPTCLAKSLASSLQGCFVDLPVALDEIYLSSTAVVKSSDLLGALGPSHCNGATREGSNKDHRLVGSHPKATGKCLVVKCLASLLIDA